MMFSKITHFFQPAPQSSRHVTSEIARLYPIYRLRVLGSTFSGYALFYVVRNNLSTVAKDMGAAIHYDKSMMGDILAITAITYGIGKLFFGGLSDRSDSRKFLALGLVLSALCNFAFGSARSYPVHLCLWGFNGFIQGMGWGPCGRSLGHWFSMRERGVTFAFWNISHNVGGGMAGIVAAYTTHLWGWSSAFYVPGIIAILGAVVLYFSLVDTPQSVGLSPIEEFKNDYPTNQHTSNEGELSFKEIFIESVLKNRSLWFVALANFFVYIARYSMLDWGPTYLREIKGASLQQGGFAIMLIEFGGIPSTILVGWFSDRLGGRRCMVSLLCMVPVLLSFFLILLNPPGHLWIDFTLLTIVGFFIYPPVMLLGVVALDICGKKAIGAAAGFVGLFGYLGRTAQAKGFGWISNHYGNLYGQDVGWDYVLFTILGCGVLAIVFFLPLWNLRPEK